MPTACARPSGCTSRAGVTIEADRPPHPLACTQDHHAIDRVGFEARGQRVGELVREGTLAEYRTNPELRARAVRGARRRCRCSTAQKLRGRAPVGDGDRPDGLHRLQRLRRRLPGGEQHPGRRARSRCCAGARCTGSASTATSTGEPGRSPAIALPAGGLPALRERAVRAGLPGGRDACTADEGLNEHGLQPLRRHALLREQLPVQGAAVQLLQLPQERARGREDGLQPRGHGAQPRA